MWKTCLWYSNSAFELCMTNQNCLAKDAFFTSLFFTSHICRCAQIPEKELYFTSKKTLYWIGQNTGSIMNMIQTIQTYQVGKLTKL